MRAMVRRIATGALLAVAVALLAWPLPAHAQLTPEQVQEARQHFKAAMDAEKANDYAKAYTEYAAAYEVTKDAKLLYRMGKAKDGANEKREAVALIQIDEPAPPEVLRKFTALPNILSVKQIEL